ncbi:SIS domain-containing protein [Acidiferrimicrobium sp. IK]|uniref:D-sedoheptulose-7-phosphate isomerase n=1 Tax=Acidiferrimicrobium sp. IK TaxID=2871700 RepID=UPI0021CB5A01|nr:SIS domain-containing protein [Acidiferrimicrobium sp. IK]MCU4183089.1 SIS domain-containing protein [Acidiferrimicrobium sp. IK]
MTVARSHLDALRSALDTFEDVGTRRVEAWGARLAARLSAGARLLTVGNGGSAAHAEHLASEMVGRYFEDRPPFSAIALHVDGSAVSALVNDYGVEEMFTRQVRAHGRAGDVLVAFSTSGRSPNVVAAASAATGRGMEVWSLTGGLPNPLAEASTEVLAVPAPRTATVQEVHQVAIHLLCAAFDRALLDGPVGAGSRARRLVP